MASIEISPDALRGSGDQVRDVATRLAQELAALRADLEGFGQPWGADDIGSLIGAAYTEIAAYAMESYQSAQEELDSIGTDVSTMADRYAQTEEATSARFRALLDRTDG
jgi:uncharacterized protein YukE